MRFNEFFFGFFYPFKSIKLYLQNKKLLIYSILPIVINLVVYGSIFILSSRWLIDIIYKITGAGSAESGIWVEILNILILIVGILLLLLVCYFLFIIFGGLVTAPFNEKISQLVEKKMGIFNTKSLGFWSDVYNSIKTELQKLFFYFSILLIIFLISFVPVIGSIISISVGLVFSFFFQALDFLDFPMARRALSLTQKLKITQSGGLLTYGFGAMAFLLMYLPIINVLTKPILVFAGTMLYFEKGYGSKTEI